MKARIVTLPFNAQLGCFDDTVLREFLADKELVDLQDHFFVHGGHPYLTVVLTYHANGEVPSSSAKSGPRRRDSWRELLEPGDLPLFNTLREWRSQKAKDEGIPPYVICTNRQLAEVVRARPQSLNKLGEIEGFGSAKLSTYGAGLVALLRAGQAPPEESDDG